MASLSPKPRPAIQLQLSSSWYCLPGQYYGNNYHHPCQFDMMISETNFAYPPSFFSERVAPRPKKVFRQVCTITAKVRAERFREYARILLGKKKVDKYSGWVLTLTDVYDYAGSADRGLVKKNMAALIYLPVFPHQNLFCSRENQPNLGGKN